MSTLDDYLNDLRQLSNNLNKIVESAIIKNEGLILQRLKLRLFNTGIDGSGKKITPEYSENTVAIKIQNNQRTSHVTLRDTGIFYASMYLDYDERNNQIFVDSDDPKKMFLIDKYGPDILGLTKEDQDFIIFSIIEPEIIKELNKINNRKIDL